MRVVYFGTYRSEYSRNKILITGLKENGIEVVECHETLWKDINDRVSAASGGWLNFSFLLRFITVYWRLFVKGLKLSDYDVLICGYPGQFDVFLARIISWIHRRVFVWDIFMSIYLISKERELDCKSPFTSFVLRSVEYFAVRLPNLLIQDTQDYVLWISEQYRIPISRFKLVPTGADNHIFMPQDVTFKAPDQVFTVLYYGTFIPNHGVPYIIRAAQILKDHPSIVFVFVGDGPELEFCKSLSTENQLKNIIYKQWMDQNDLVHEIAQSNICLGAFGNTPQSLMTVQNKIYEAMACARPIVTGDSGAVKNLLTHQVSAWLCDRNHPESLAEAILTLHSNASLCQDIARNGYDIYCRSYTVLKLGEMYASHLRGLISND